jgi:hypothetical protein
MSSTRRIRGYRFLPLGAVSKSAAMGAISENLPLCITSFKRDFNELR